METGLNQNLGTSTTIGADIGTTQLNKTKKDYYEQQRIDCLRKGGKWNAETNTCDLDVIEGKEDPYKIKTPELNKNDLIQKDKAKVPKGTIETFSSNKTGRASGVVMPDGRTFLGLSPDDVNLIAEGEAAKVARPINSAPVGTAQTQLEQRQKLQQAIQNIGQVGQLTPAEEAPINYSQAAMAGLANVLPSAVGGAAGGALLGGVAGAGVGSTVTAPGGALVGGLGGSISGFASGFLRNIKTQQKGELQAANAELATARTNMRQLAMMATQDPANADLYVSAYNDQLTRIHQARLQTKAETTGDLNAFMEDGRVEMAKFDDFLRVGGLADMYGRKLNIALQTNTPLTLDSFSEAELNDMGF